MAGPNDTAEPPFNLTQSFALACRMAGPIEILAAHRVSGAEQSFALGQPFALIGRDPAVAVRLDDPSVSRCHAYLQIVDGRPYCVDLGSRTGVIWDDGSQGRGWVAPGQALRIGQFDVLIESRAGGPPPAPDRGEPPALSPAVVEVYHPAWPPGGTFPLDQPLTLVGRHPGCQLRFLDDAIGYFHCILVNTPVGVWCVDVLSAKGTLLNGRSVRLARLRDGDLIELGKVSLVLRPAPPVGPLVAVRGETVARPVTDPLSMIPHPSAGPGVGGYPLRELMDHFQQCVTTLARMFTAMQQEHVAMVSDQMRQVRELTRELRELRAELQGEAAAGQAAPLPGAAYSAGPPPAAPGLPTQTVGGGPGDQTLADAHAWFLEQLTRLGQQPPVPPNRG